MENDMSKIKRLQKAINAAYDILNEAPAESGVEGSAAAMAFDVLDQVIDECGPEDRHLTEGEMDELIKDIDLDKRELVKIALQNSKPELSPIFKKAAQALVPRHERKPDKYDELAEKLKNISNHMAASWDSLDAKLRQIENESRK